MGLKIRFGLVFGIALGFFITLVVFGNLVGPSAIRSVDEKISNINTLTPVARLEPSRYFNPVTSENLTKKLAAAIGKNIIELNPQGPRTINGQEQLVGVPEAEAMAETALAQISKSLDENFFRPAISQEEIKIDSQQTAILYQGQLAKILAANILRSPFDWQNAAPDNLERIIGSYNVLLNQLYKLAVPSEEKWRDFHTELLSLITGQKLIIEALKNAEADPLKAILAVESAPTINQAIEALLNQLKS